jgi:hypothetical protein
MMTTTERQWLFSAVTGSVSLLFFPRLHRGAGFCLFFNSVAEGEEDGELRKNNDAFVMENGSGLQLGRKKTMATNGCFFPVFISSLRPLPLFFLFSSVSCFFLPVLSPLSLSWPFSGFYKARECHAVASLGNGQCLFRGGLASVSFLSFKN